MGRPAIFFDRDGTLSHEIGYVNHLSRFRLLPFAIDAVRLTNASGRLAVLVTNQAGVARGYFPESLIHEVHGRVRAEMEAGDARLDAIYVCVHHPSAGEAPRGAGIRPTPVGESEQSGRRPRHQRAAAGLGELECFRQPVLRPPIC